jgi:hypothetical protein
MKQRRALALAALAPLMALMIDARAAGQGCDRACLKNLADSYVAALVAHDPSKVPLARNIRTVENIKRIQPGGSNSRTARSPRPNMWWCTRCASRICRICRLRDSR